MKQELKSLPGQSRRQVETWRDSETIFRHVALSTEDNWIAYTNLGVVMQEQGELGQALALYRQAISLQPPDVVANKNIGMVFAAAGDNPVDIRPRFLLGSCLSQLEGIAKQGRSLTK